ncbi:DciA family protein [Natroniella sp. ANB-PHB2]|uniref:DciA family protein n=1 Tax=Natroniella sp. ANB-PHB2 TaxID=3384444 RepID=UPI0038D3FCB5
MPKSIKEVLEQTLNQLGIENKIKEKQVLGFWKKINKKEINLHTEAKYINNGVLFVTVDDPTWAHQLLFMKKKLIQKINDKLDINLVKDIRFKVGSVFKKKSNSQSEGENNYQKIKLSLQEQEGIKEITQEISDPNLKNNLYKLMKTFKEKNKWKKINSWKVCPSCSVLTSPKNDKCPICELKNNKKLSLEIESLLSSSPWIKYKDITELYPNLTKKEFESVKNNLLKKLKTKIDQLMIKALEQKTETKQIKVIIQNYVMLKTEIKPTNLTNRLIKEMIGNNYMKIYQRL